MDVREVGNALSRSFPPPRVPRRRMDGPIRGVLIGAPISLAIWAAVVALAAG